MNGHGFAAYGPCKPHKTFSVKRHLVSDRLPRLKRAQARHLEPPAECPNEGRAAFTLSGRQSQWYRYSIAKRNAQSYHPHSPGAHPRRSHRRMGGICREAYPPGRSVDHRPYPRAKRGVPHGSGVPRAPEMQFVPGRALMGARKNPQCNVCKARDAVMFVTAPYVRYCFSCYQEELRLSAEFHVR